MGTAQWGSGVSLLSAIISANIVLSCSNIFLLFWKQSSSYKMGYPKDFYK